MSEHIFDHVTWCYMLTLNSVLCRIVDRLVSAKTAMIWENEINNYYDVHAL